MLLIYGSSSKIDIIKFLSIDCLPSRCHNRRAPFLPSNMIASFVITNKYCFQFHCHFLISGSNAYGRDKDPSSCISFLRLDVTQKFHLPHTTDFSYFIPRLLTACDALSLCLLAQDPCPRVGAFINRRLPTILPLEQ